MLHLPYGVASFTASQNALSTNAEVIFAARPTRVRAVVKNLDAAISIYIGAADTVSSTTGLTLLAGESVEVFTTAAIYAIAASGTPSVGLMEEYA